MRTTFVSLTLFFAFIALVAFIPGRRTRIREEFSTDEWVTLSTNPSNQIAHLQTGKDIFRRDNYVTQSNTASFVSTTNDSRCYLNRPRVVNHQSVVDNVYQAASNAFSPINSELTKSQAIVTDTKSNYETASNAYIQAPYTDNLPPTDSNLRLAYDAKRLATATASNDAQIASSNYASASNAYDNALSEKTHWEAEMESFSGASNVAQSNITRILSDAKDRDDMKYDVNQFYESEYAKFKDSSRGEWCGTNPTSKLHAVFNDSEAHGSCFALDYSELEPRSYCTPTGD